MATRGQTFSPEGPTRQPAASLLEASTWITSGRVGWGCPASCPGARHLRHGLELGSRQRRPHHAHLGRPEELVMMEVAEVMGDGETVSSRAK